MCLTACYRAWISRLVYAATSHDVATNGFEDLQFYRQWARPNADRTLLREVPDESLREDAASVLRQWAAQLPFEAEPKF
ncbi:hypothetical protein CRI70_30410 [Streptomyces sp. Ru87]|nr:hypothetical protein CRI70_30410 [Streptomyces sp. Ru87]